MLEKARRALKQLTCRHEWQKTGVFQDIDCEHNVRYAIHRYNCAKCGKMSCQDSRNDRLEPLAK